ncbi:twin-arginine translocase subunit TatC [Natroniella sulfidigena]|uniref:twin-arginine translocase subunit TatC n=1 Tax=Natroniella sulfidigena TaxID=723921 RepID=UPI002009FF83|nr:twin-arginine translocase subunit TatC [Natroniella sulfidigena]MCK8816092.1 twin-arginine translocase subunit TatC [Natroniella sulfidigena]
MSDTQMSLVEHLGELRKRLLIAIGAIIVLALGSYVYATEIIDFLIEPVGQELVYLTPTEAFFTEIKVAVFTGFLIALPVVLYQAWSFVLPGLKHGEKKYIRILLPLSVIFFLIGVAFAQFIVIPLGVSFFLSFTSENLQAMFSLSNYISFVISLLIPFGLIFELPLLITLLVKLKLITHKFLTRNRKYVIVLIFLFGAILTPPDIVSQTMMALPLIVLYEGSILIAKIIE